MPQLVSPTVLVRDSYLEGERAMCVEEGGSTAFLEDAKRDFEGFVERRRGVREMWDVPVTELWFVEASSYIGTVVIRHELTPALAVEGGHIGFHVVPGLRNRGHATEMAAQAVPNRSQDGSREAVDHVCGRQCLVTASQSLERGRVGER